MEFHGGNWVDFIIPTYKPRNWMSKNSDFPQLLVNADLELKAGLLQQKAHWPLSIVYSIHQTTDLSSIMFTGR